MQVKVDIIYRDIDDVFAPSFNACEIENNEATESWIFLHIVQNALACYAERNIGSNGFLALKTFAKTRARAN